MKLKTKLFLSAATLVAILGGITYYSGSSGSKLPESMNMGEMDSMPAMYGMTGMNGAHSVSVTQLVASKSVNAPVKTFNLIAKTKQIDIGKGHTIDALTFNGTVPGPEIRVKEGDRVIVHLKNALTEGVTIHWHGVPVPNAEDGVAGVTQNAVPPHGEFTYDFIAKTPGTYWYHSHQKSNDETTTGLYGALVVEPKSPAVQIRRDYTVVIHDWDNGVSTLNGTCSDTSFKAKPGDRVNLRLVNSSSNSHTIAVVGVPFKVISMDAHDINGPSILHNTLIPIAASMRYDILFQLPESGVKVIDLDSKSGGNALDALWARITGRHEVQSISFGKVDVPVNIDTLRSQKSFDFTSYGSPQTNGPRNRPQDRHGKYNEMYHLVLGSHLGFFNQSPTMVFTVNGYAYPNIPPIQVKVGDLVWIRMENHSNDMHPMHIHGHSFRILAKNGQPLSGSPIYLDTVPVGPHETYDVEFVANNPGIWMLHCHDLDHAAHGMDLMVNYQGITTPFTVGRASGNEPD